MSKPDPNNGMKMSNESKNESARDIRIWQAVRLASELFLENRIIDIPAYSAAIDSGFATGKYAVRKRAGGHPVYFDWVVLDGQWQPIVAGTQTECERFAEKFNTLYAQYLLEK